ncbi:hypothetical protein E2320_019096, partial [Naja naja]
MIGRSQHVADGAEV